MSGNSLLGLKRVNIVITISKLYIYCKWKWFIYTIYNLKIDVCKFLLNILKMFKIHAKVFKILKIFYNLIFLVYKNKSFKVYISKVL